MSSQPLEIRILKGVQNMIQKRGEKELIEIESKCGLVAMNDKTILFIPPTTDNSIDKIKNEHVNFIVYLLQEHNKQHAIVAHDAIAPQAYEILRTHTVSNIELFMFKHLLFDPTTHVLTPPHTRIKIEDIGKMFKAEHLPKILTTDPIVRFYGWKVGDVIEIKQTTGYNYRVVCE